MMNIAEDATLEERVNTAYRRLVVIESAAAADTDAVCHDPEETLNAIQELAREAAEALAPLKDVPGTVGNWKPGDVAKPESDPRPPKKNGAGLRVVQTSALTEPIAS